jgi:hypothetical protein
LEIGERTGARVLVLTCRCSDPEEWRRRLEARQGMDLAHHHTIDRAGVEAFDARTAADSYTVTVPNLVVDTTAPLERNVETALAWLRAGDAVDEART